MTAGRAEGAASAADERAVHAASSSVLGMVLFVASEAMFFAAFFGAYFTAYATQPVWPPKGIVMPSLALPTLSAAVLLASAGTLNAALRASRRAATRALLGWLGLTVAAGAVFVALSLYGYAQLGFGIRSSMFASLFYLVTALGLAHVAGGMVLLGLVAAQARGGQLAVMRYEPVQVASVYWNFVVVLGLVIYVVLYVMNSTSG